MLGKLFHYYGSKWSIADKYPEPEYQLIIEPFAGAAGYASYWADDHDVLLLDANPVIAKLWQWLIRVDEDVIRKLPAPVETTDGITPQEAQWLIGFWINQGGAQPKRSMTTWGKERPQFHWNETIRESVATQLRKIREWTCRMADYRAAPDIEATWFIDPPYCGNDGKEYSVQVDNYRVLADWCRTRRGQVIVCEQEGAWWLPFESLGSFKCAGSSNRDSAHTHEVIWTND